jgi:hypothetical protein
MTANRQSLQQGGDSRPGWVRNFEDSGRRWWRRPTEEERARARQAGYVASIVVNAILLVIAHSLPGWGIPFLTPAFADVLWAIDLSLGTTIIANALYFAYDARWFRGLTLIGLTGLSLLSTVVLYRVFPFDFGDASGDDLARLALTMVIFAIVIAIIVQIIAWFAKLVRGALGQE